MAGWDEVSGLFVGSVTDLGHGGLSLESSSDLGLLVVYTPTRQGDGRRWMLCLCSVLDSFILSCRSFPFPRFVKIFSTSNIHILLRLP